MVTTRQEAEWWLRAGERDLLSAVGLHQLSIFEGTAFHCQQAAEKVPPEVATACRRLDHHYVDARYPNGVGGPPDDFYDEVIADLALTDCRLVQGFVEANLHG